MLQVNETSTAINKLFIEHYQQLYSAALKVAKHPDRAEDIMQDAYIKVLSAGNTQIRQPLSYLFQVVRNLSIDHHRRYALEQGLFTDDDEVGWTVLNECQNLPEQIAISQQILESLHKLLTQLPERTRSAFEMNRIEGHTQRYVAEKLGVSTTLVNFMIRDAMTHCQQILD